jgi:hypothetical protein
MWLIIAGLGNVREDTEDLEAEEISVDMEAQREISIQLLQMELDSGRLELSSASGAAKTC